MRRLRILHVLVQPVLVWDDGDELQPGPEIKPTVTPASQLADFVERLPAEVEALAKQQEGQG